MENFSFNNPTKIHFGEGQASKIATELPAKARVLLVYGGGSIKRNGVYEDVTASLAGHFVVEFSGVEPNPKYETLMQSLPLIKENNLDYILAVGGGSVLDGCKFIAAAALYDGEDPWDILSKGAAIQQALPIGVVLTLPATGSETNANAVVTRAQDKLAFSSAAVYPQFAVLDPAYTLSLSERQIGNGVVDAFVHVIEQYLTYSVNAKVQDRFSEGVLLTLIEEGPKALAKETAQDMGVRRNIMWAASVALQGQLNVGVPQDWATHLIGHELTGAHDIDHARTLSIVLPAVMKVCKKAKEEKLLQYAERVWNLHSGTKMQRIDAAIAKTETFFKTMLLPTRLSDLNLTQRDISPLVEKLVEHGNVSLGEHGAITPEVSQAILETAL